MNSLSELIIGAQDLTKQTFSIVMACALVEKIFFDRLLLVVDL